MDAQGQGGGEICQDLPFEAFRHLTTLNAGSIVLIGTFLKDIFPKSDQGTLAVNLISKLAIFASFVFFGISLAVSAYSMYWVATKNVDSGALRKAFLRLVGSSEDKFSKLMSYVMPLAGAFFFSGLCCFGFAVLKNLL